MKTKIIFSVFLIFSIYSHAAYLSNVSITITQPNGTKIECFATGDEYYNWVHDKEGYTIIQNDKTGYYCYAILNGDELAASKYVVGEVSPKSVNLTPQINISRAKILEKMNDFILSTPQEQNTRNFKAVKAATGTLNNIVVYIRFADQAEFFANQQDYTALFNNTTGNSMRNYFNEVSYNQLDIISHFYPINNGTVILSYQDSYNTGYYCQYNAVTNPSGYTDEQRTNREHTLLLNAINYIKNQIPSSLNIDYDNDGFVDNICFIIRSTSMPSSILWPHKWGLYSYDVRINNKRAYTYNIQSDSGLLPSQNNGVLCHEMNHTFGAPDLYHPSGDASPVGIWDVMASSQNPPGHMGAYMKYKYGGWISSIPSITASGTYTLQPLTSATNNCYKIPIYGSSEYIVVEYRKKTGIFENSLPNSGLIIYRINEIYEGNYTGWRYGGIADEVYIFRRDGTLSADGYVYDAHFSETSPRTTFSNSTNPYCFVSNGNYGNLYVKNIRENANGTLSFDVRFCDNTNIVYSNTSNLPTLTNAFNKIQTSGTVIVKNTDNVTFEAGNVILLNSGFEVKVGGVFEMNINSCGNK